MDDRSKHAVPKQSFLDPEGVAALFVEVEAADRLLAVLPKEAPGTYVENGPTPTLAEAQDALLSGRLHALQLRYLKGGEEWFDTLLVHSRGFRLVRIRHPAQ